MATTSNSLPSWSREYLLREIEIERRHLRETPDNYTCRSLLAEYMARLSQMDGTPSAPMTAQEVSRSSWRLQGNQPMQFYPPDFRLSAENLEQMRTMMSNGSVISYSTSGEANENPDPYGNRKALAEQKAKKEPEKKKWFLPPLQP